MFLQRDIAALCGCVAVVFTHGSPSQALANIDVSLQSTAGSVAPGGLINFRVVASSDNQFDQFLSASQVIVTWNTLQLQLLGLTNVGAVPLLVSSFGPEPYGLNTSLSDGDAMWLGYAQLGNPVAAMPMSAGGTLLTTLRFQALSSAPLGLSHVSIQPSAGNPTGYTTVFDGFVPNLNVTGNLTGSSVQIVPCPGIGTTFILAGIWCGRRRRRT